MLGDGEVQFGWICVREIVEAKRRLVAKDAGWPIASDHVTRATRGSDPGAQALERGPAYKFRGARESSCLPGHDRFVCCWHSRASGLFRGEIAPLRFGKLVELLLPFAGRRMRLHKRSTFWTYYAIAGRSK